MPIIENISPLLTEDDLYALWLRVNPPYRRSQFDGLPIGEIPFRAFAAIWARVMKRVDEMEMSALTCKATGASFADGRVTITWSTGTTEGFTINEGQILVQTPWRVRYRTTEPFSVAAGSPPGTTVDVIVQSEWSGHEANVEARDVNQFAIPFPDLCDALDGIVWATGVTETAKQEFIDGIESGEITVLASTDLTGGSLATLDLIASEKGLPRGENESDESLRIRLKRLPRTVTRHNIMAEVNDYLESLGIDSATMFEWFEGGIIVGEWVVGEGASTAPPSFCIVIPNLSEYVEDGIIVDEWIVGEDHPGDDTSSKDGIIQGLRELVDRIKLGGVCATIIEEA